ncbi:DUF1203 domain-containing protein [Agrobacterium rubi]|uniref:DUF1203 domain-containing protein n=1 Tax=Agrobacterium rubi TaxID=28099 RepID=UPI001573C131|nr:DUF1203 domain-containing protein [Agrobacterium rubi]NTF07143.1 DUF1203 domain-containing protein [Agrobacterium rubi]NTF19399.1 DUF1203 domain-containing protein [Agrobacterium rubi]NTF26362.1 DUF1203 domain-containing protein [Agrobacterium rubi]
MTTIIFTAIHADEADAIRHGALDANGQKPERSMASGSLPCRVCLGQIKDGEAALLLAYRPFPNLQPFAETGPIFIHAEPCGGYTAQEILPPMLESPDYIVRGYSHADRIVYGTGAVTATDRIIARAKELLASDDIAYAHVRSARNNCYQCRIERA